MGEIDIKAASQGHDSSEYFRTVTDDTTLYTVGVAACIAGLFYRSGHLGLGHFNPDMGSVVCDISRVVKPEMEEYGTGDIRFALMTGVSFATREEFQGQEGIERYQDYINEIEGRGLVHDEDNSKTYELTNHEIAQAITRLEARLVGEAFDKVRVRIQYCRRGEKDPRGMEERIEEFEIDMATNETTRIRTPAPSHRNIFQSRP